MIGMDEYLVTDGCRLDGGDPFRRGVVHRLAGVLRVPDAERVRRRPRQVHAHLRPPPPVSTYDTIQYTTITFQLNTELQTKLATNITVHSTEVKRYDLIINIMLN